MNLPITLVCLATACLGSPLPDEKIVGGNSVTIEQYPYQLSLEIRGVHSCGASIISPNWALTATQCVGWPVNYITLRAGSSTRESGGTVYQVAQVIVHPWYGIGNNDYDVAVLKVATPFALGPTVRMVALPDENESVPTGAMTLVSGWGSNAVGGVLPLELQAVSVPIISQSDCQKAYLVITPRMICANVPVVGGKGFCEGDTGGPLVYDSTLVGIVSWSYDCARPKFPGIYTRVAALRGWILGATGV